jgi:putative SOS response-associated peptidase YedK
MCSRYSLTSPHEAVRAYFKVTGGNGDAPFPPRYNIGPTQPVLIVRNSARQERELTLVRWGMIPSWVKNPGEFATLINARSETAAEKPSFRGALRHRRCLVPADGFYEWSGSKGAKQPHLIRPKAAEGAGHLMALAGLWENWVGADGSEIETMAILTTAANTTVATVHDRMPVILAPADFDRWLDCTPGSATPVGDLMAPASDDLLEIIAVSRQLNNVRNEGAQLLAVAGDSSGDTSPKLL